MVRRQADELAARQKSVMGFLCNLFMQLGKIFAALIVLTYISSNLIFSLGSS